MRRTEHLALIAVGGSAGALARRWISMAGSDLVFPWPTFIANVVGCALVAIFTTDGIGERAHRLMAIGFCGGLTTFSTLTVEVARLHDRGESAVAATYPFVSMAVGVASFVGVRALSTKTNSEVGS